MRISKLLATASLFALPAFPVAAQDPSTAIIGTWKIVEHVRKDVASGALEKPLGENPQGRLIYTKGGHSVWFQVGDQPKLSGPAPTTDAERAELFKVLVAFAGTYKIEGSRIVANTEVAWVPGFRSQGATVESSGNKLVLTSQPFKSGMTGREAVTVTTAERLE